ncbi:serine/threonine-protein kinase HipA [Pseudomonas sp. BIGb0408]|uniref:Serine/threonine-protein kinase HipA n=1 Tax=Phytopseudomonas flavescens TaxID=29435 RepID=A0A7Z0BPR2_9GAMM|nr:MULTISPECIES: HipA domain-containing protein [Pseudomonas]MCW2290450.1 serine/threonine-protein kinase HipA [Pseudomonas sp. BIGb0408]NYH74977.1 serine/threonine-protein kinase HipA [Pseudomonas flavescens]
MAAEEVSALRLSLQGQLVGYVAGFDSNRNLLSLAPEYIDNPQRLSLTLSMSSQNKFQAIAPRLFPLARRMQLHPLLSNLLPEGALRELLAQRLKIDQMNEFPLMVHLGADLPGALLAEPVPADDVPDYAFGDRGRLDRIAIDAMDRVAHFSLAGVQMKFSMRNRDGRYIMGDSKEPGDWIIKTPSTRHPYVPANEFTCMTLAGLIGVAIPEIRLVGIEQLEQLPEINLPNESVAYAIRRFDREANQRIHTEDFAQVTFSYAAQKYEAASYESIAGLIYKNVYAGQLDVIQMAIRLLANILLGNGDAHKKNWSIIYRDGITPSLSPAYDILFTRVYMGDEQELGLSMAGTKRWYDVTMEHFMAWADRADLPKSAINYNLRQAINAARVHWPQALAESPMAEQHKKALRAHWRALQPDFRIEA